jgi:hypothetical protein
MSDMFVIDKNGGGKWVEEKDGPQAFEINDAPRLMIIARNHLSNQGHENVRCAIKEWEAGERKHIIFDAQFDVFQLVNGRWEPLAATERESVYAKDIEKFMARMEKTS